MLRIRTFRVIVAQGLFGMGAQPQALLRQPALRPPVGARSNNSNHPWRYGHRPVAAKTQVFVVLWYQYGGLSDADAGAVAALAGLGGLLGNVLGGVVGDWAHRQR